VGIYNLNALKPGNEDDWDLLKDLLSGLDIPPARFNHLEPRVSNESARLQDLQWLDRNLMIRNKGEDAEHAHVLVKKILKTL
jgi:hypothetical protein